MTESTSTPISMVFSRTIHVLTCRNDTENTPNLVTEVTAKYTAEDVEDQLTAVEFKIIKLQPWPASSSSTEFTPFEDLTESQIWVWVDTQFPEYVMHERLTRELDRQRMMKRLATDSSEITIGPEVVPVETKKAPPWQDPKDVDLTDIHYQSNQVKITFTFEGDQ
jgi:hypothetical protein